MHVVKCFVSYGAPVGRVAVLMACVRPFLFCTWPWDRRMCQNSDSDSWLITRESVSLQLFNYYRRFLNLHLKWSNCSDHLPLMSCDGRGGLLEGLSFGAKVWFFIDLIYSVLLQKLVDPVWLCTDHVSIDQRQICWLVCWFSENLVIFASPKAIIAQSMSATVLGSFTWRCLYQSGYVWESVWVAGG